MKKITHLIIYALLVVLAGCEKDTEPKNFAPRLTTGEATGIYRKGATLSGNIEKAEGIVVKEYGFLYSTLQGMAEYTKVKIGNNGGSDFTAGLQNLEAGKTYYYCSYAYGGYSTAKGEIKSFTTVNSSEPVFTELVVADTDEKSFTVSTSILDDGGSELFVCGFCWKEAGGESSEPTEKDNVMNVSSADDFRIRISDLTPGRRYAVRAYAVNANGRGYGNVVFVTTEATALPAVSSCTPVDSTAVTITLSARILAEGTSGITEKGFCYSTETKLPTIANMKQVVPGEGNDIYASIGELKAETTYYIRAYALNGLGAGYGDVFEFTTLPSSSVPTVGKVIVGNLTTTTAEVTSSVTDNGGVEIIEKGFCYTTDGVTPTLDNSKTISAVTGPVISATLGSLTEGTNYRICAYAINKNGVGYGEVTEFTTVAVVIPTVKTFAALDITETGARLSGIISADGNGTVIRKGFCWSTEQSVPTVGNDYEEVVGPDESFTLVLNRLTPGMPYYFRAYAENEKGIGYGEVQAFTTIKELHLPAVGSTMLSDITENAVSASSVIGDDGGAPVVSKGFCYSAENTAPELGSDMNIASASSGGSISAIINGLSGGTRYYIRAYAVNSQGIGYGPVAEFETEKTMNLPEISNITVTDLTPASFKVGAAITDTGGGTVEEKGYCYVAGEALPTINDARVSDTQSGMKIEAVISGLSAKTTYTVRAFARNEKGIAYSAPFAVTTKKNEPSSGDATFPDIE